MSNAWGHTVRPLSQEEIEYQVKAGKNWHEWRIKNLPETISDIDACIHSERKCRISSKCKNLCTHLLTYRYITGRAGRTSYAEKPICEYHAQKYITTPAPDEAGEKGKTQR